MHRRRPDGIPRTRNRGDAYKHFDTCRRIQRANNHSGRLDEGTGRPWQHRNVEATKIHLHLPRVKIQHGNHRHLQKDKQHRRRRLDKTRRGRHIRLQQENIHQHSAKQNGRTGVCRSILRRPRIDQRLGQYRQRARHGRTTVVPLHRKRQTKEQHME